MKDPKLLVDAWYCSCGGFQPRPGVMGEPHDLKVTEHRVTEGDQPRPLFERRDPLERWSDPLKRKSPLDDVWVDQGGEA